LKVLVNITLYFIGGLLAGILSLILLAIIPPLNYFSLKYLTIGINALVEEGIKLIFLWHLFILIQKLTSVKKILLFAIIFALGFSFFEALLIDLNSATFLSPFFTFSIAIHIITSSFLILFIYKYQKQQKLSTQLIIYLTLAIFIHLCYNLIVGIS
jgi:RsiW-degrading membrane proteinase PrsW (M82 family)